MSITSSAAQSVDHTVNLEIIVDASGSMAAATDVGTTRIDAAKQVLNDVIGAIPKVNGVNVGLRVYGHKGDNTDAGRPESCVSSDLLVPVSGVDTGSLKASVDQLAPVGWTPIAYSLEAAAKDFPEPASDSVSNAIVVVTDGIETCDGDPVATAQKLRNSDLGIVTTVIGFGTTPEDQLNLQNIAKAGGGQLLGSNNAGQLMDALFSVLEKLKVVETSGTGKSRESPVAVGRIGRVGDYDVSVIRASADTNSQSTGNMKYFTAQVSVTYQGTASGHPATDLLFSAVGDLNSSYTTAKNACAQSLGQGPDSVNELFPGGSAEFNVCWLIDERDVGSMRMFVETPTNPGSGRVWFDLLGTGTPEATSPNKGTNAPEVVTPTEGAAVVASSELFVDAGDINFTPKDLTMPANTDVALMFTNKGVLQHDFVIDNPSVSSGVLNGGQSITITINLPPGTYTFYCDVPGHKEAGQVGTLVVN